MLDWTAGLPAAARCPLCGDNGPHSRVVSVANPWAPGEALRFHRCAGCRSLLVPGGTFHEFSDDDAPALGWRHYVQLGAGIDAMLRPAEIARGPGAPSLLDVGCGFGFTLDYWQSTVGAEAVGVEPSAFGRVGARMLGVDLHVALLADVAALRGRRFGVVLSSEVIEHVPDPAAFVRELRERLAPGGVMVLTTPNAGFIAPDSPVAFVLATLSPGLHKLLLSRDALDALLRDAGLAHVRVDVEGPRLVAWASQSELALRHDPAALRGSYISYLGRRWADEALEPDLRLGFGYRLLKETVNEGRLEEAMPVAAALRDLVQMLHGFDLVDADAVRTAVLPASGLAAYAEAAPFPLGPILFFRAMAAAQGALPGEDAAAGFALAHEILAHSLRVAPDYFQEAATLAWPALLEEGGALLRAGQAEAAAARLRRLHAARAAPPPDCPVAVPDDVAARAAALDEAIRLALLPPAPPPATEPKPEPEPTRPEPLAEEPQGILALWHRLRRR